MQSVDEFFFTLEGQVREVGLLLHDLMVEDLNLVPKIRYGIPFYFGKSWVCYINVLKTGKVELAFPRGNELEDTMGLLLSKGRKQVKSIELEGIDDLLIEKIRSLVTEAIQLDQQVKYRSKRSQ